MRKPKGMEAQLFEDTKKRFQQICEYTIPTYTIDEAGDEGQEQEMPQDPNIPPQGGPDPNIPPQGGDPNMGQQPPMGDQGQGGEMTAGFNPQEPAPEAPMPNENMPSEEDNVVDITDITDAQDETKEKVDDLNTKFAMVMQKLNDFEDFIKGNDEKIEELKAEYERRNPTQVEKMSMNTAKGGPFNISPEEYWDEKEATSNYRREDDNNGKEQGQYVITVNDINGTTDWRQIANSLNDDFVFNQTLENALKF